jgi:O-antigen ligase
MDVASDPALGDSKRWKALIKRAAALPVNTFSSLILCVAVAGAPLLFGSREPSTVAFWVLWLGVAIIPASPRLVRTPQAWLLAGVAFVIAAYAFVLHEQLSIHPWVAEPHPLWAEASKVLGVELQPSVSIARNAPYYNLGPVAANILALVLGLVTGLDRRFARRVLVAAGWAGAIYAAYGIFADLFTPTSILWREKEAYIGVVTGTFINRNTAAAYFGSMAVIWLLILLEAIRDRLPHGMLRWRYVWEKIILQARADMMVPFLLFFLCLSALFMTQSRGGVIFSIGAFILTFWLFFYRDLMGRANRALTIIAAILISLVLFQVLTGAIGNRLDTQGLADAGRIITYKSTLKMIADHPWFGTGLGTFVWSFPAYRSDDVSMWGVWDMAHSTPLQMASEVGIPLTLVAALAWLVALAVLLRAVFTRRRDTIIPLAAFAISFIGLGDSMIDFSLQIAGYSIVVFGLLGVGLAQSFRSPASLR